MLNVSPFYNEIEYFPMNPKTTPDLELLVVSWCLTGFNSSCNIGRWFTASNPRLGHKPHLDCGFWVSVVGGLFTGQRKMEDETDNLLHHQRKKRFNLSRCFSALTVPRRYRESRELGGGVDESGMEGQTS